MTLRELAYVAGVAPKRVINTLRAVAPGARYSEALARRLAIALTVHDATGIPLRRSFQLAARALRAYAAGEDPVRIRGHHEDATLVIDVRRILSACAIRLSALRSLLHGRERGRPPSRHKNPLEVATEWGIDISLLEANLALSAAERLRQLDGMAAFARSVRRVRDEAG